VVILNSVLNAAALARVNRDCKLCGPDITHTFYVTCHCMTPMKLDVHRFRQVWYPHRSLPVVVTAEALRIGREYPINNATYRQLLLSCPLPHSSSKFDVSEVSQSVEPTHVSMTASPCSQSSVFLPVIRDTSRSTQEPRGLPLGICVAISFGSLPTEELVEWFELNRLLGIGEFNIYNASMSSDLDDVLNYYENHAGVLKVHQMEPPVYDQRDGITLDTIKASNHSTVHLVEITVMLPQSKKQ
jgi:Glycosyltransferase family 92